MNISIITYFLILKILFCMHLQLHISHKKVLETEKFLSTQQTQHVVQLILYFSKECMNLHNDNMRKMTTDFTKKNHCRKLIPFNLILFILLVDVLFDIENIFLTTKAAQKSVVSSSSILKDSRKKMVLQVVLQNSINNDDQNDRHKNRLVNKQQHSLQ